MRRHLLWFVVGGAACAASRPVTELGAAASPSIAIEGLSGTFRGSATSSRSVTDLSFTSDDVWKVLPAAFDSLGLTVTASDPVQHIMGSQRAKVRRQLGRTPLSRYLECGGTQVGANADSYEVVLTVLAQVQPGAAGGSTLSTLLDAVAKPIALSQGYSKCSSKGLFESRLVEAVKKRLQG